jgi:phenylalanyl-tRNA synthetase beta chain
MTMKETVPLHAILATISAVGSPLLEDFYLLAIYRSDALGKDLKNVTLRFIYRDKTKTLSQEVVDVEHERIKTTIEKKLK